MRLRPSRTSWETRGEHFIVSAPKGFGKTLLLIAKRKQMEEHGGYHSAAANIEDPTTSNLASATSGGEYLDRPTGDLPLMSKSLIEQLKVDFFFWRSIWRICIMIASLKLDARWSSSTAIQSIDCDCWIKSILNDKDTTYSPCTIFTSLLKVDATTRQQVIKTAGALDPHFRAIRSPTAFFIDNVDEYFEPLLEDRRIEAGDPDKAHYRNRSNDIWTLAQLGLTGAAYGIHKENSHVKVYCTIRREAFTRLHEFATQAATQIIGCSVEIEYTREDLREIFNKNIQLMSGHRLFVPFGVDPMQAFFGPANKEMKHRFVDQVETGFDFVLRHTFYRPRDLMIIGDRIAKIDVSRRNPLSIKEAVDEATDAVVESLMGDMKPFLFLPDLEVLAPFINRNVLTKADLDAANEQYKRRFEEDESRYADDERYARPFHTMYQTGMLGWITVENDRELHSRQKFLKPREISLQNYAELPITENYYLIHSALDHRISSVAGGKYFRNFHRANVIGNDSQWIEPATSLFVVKGDMVSFSKVMDTEFYEAVASNLHAWAESVCDELDFFEVSGGDSIVMIDRSAERLFRSVTRLLSKANGYEELQLTFRFGGAAGPITFKERKRRMSGAWETHIIPLGLALRTSARLEPHAPHGSLIVDDSFFKLSQGNLEFVELGPTEVSSLVFDEPRGVFRVQKNQADPASDTRLYRAKQAG